MSHGTSDVNERVREVWLTFFQMNRYFYQMMEPTKERGAK